MAKAKKLPSGTWNVKVYNYTNESGKRHYESFSAPTKREAEYMAAKFAVDKKSRARGGYNQLTVGEAADRYIKSKDSVLAEDTLNEYIRIRSNNLKSTMRTKIGDLTQEIIQNDINAESKRISRKTKLPVSPKTIANMHGFLSAVLSVYAPDFNLRTTLPQKVKPRIEVPVDTEIQKLMDAVRDSEMEVPILLSAFGSLRRSEICALTADDVTCDGVNISKAMVKGLDKKWIIKKPKTEAGYRKSDIPSFVLEKLPLNGKITELNPDVITSRFWHIMRRAGIVTADGKPKFRFHDLRHYYASIAHALGIPDKYIMDQGGWKTDNTLKNVYQHTMSDKAKEFSDLTKLHFEKMQHEMQHRE